MDKFQPIAHFQVVPTADGSPTAFRDGEGEWMHNRKSAFEESLYIYLPAVAWAFDQVKNPTISVMGLGLGYLEMMTVGHALRCSKVDFVLESFEKEQALAQAFSDWVQGKDTRVYEKISASWEKYFELTPGAIRRELQKKREGCTWKVLGAFSLGKPLEKSHAVLYDFFSASTSPDLWDEHFLNQLLETKAGAPCAFATYAARKPLFRALKNRGFEDQNHPGFQGKRQSTLAFRLG